MTALVTKHLPLVAGAPEGIKKLRGLILELAVRGKLVDQDPDDEPADQLLQRIAEQKARRGSGGHSSKTRKSSFQRNGAIGAALPLGWEATEFQDVALEVSTGPFGSLIHQADYVTGGVPLVNPSHMIGGLIVADMTITLPPEKAEGLSSYRLNAGDMVMARRGEVGRVAIVTAAEDGWLCGTGSFVLRFTDEVSRDYIRILFFCTSVRAYLAGAAVGTTMVNLNHGILLQLPVALPPIAEQHRIVAKVDELMALCDRLEADQADAEAAHAQLVQALLDSLTQVTAAADFHASWQRLSEHFHTLFTTEVSIDALKQAVLQLAVMGRLVPQDPAAESPSVLLDRIAHDIAKATPATSSKKSRTFTEVEPTEQYINLPDSWMWTRLGSQVMSSDAGWSPNCEARQRVDDEWGVLKVSAVSWGEFRPDENKALPANLEARPGHEVQTGDFLVSRANTAELVARSVVVESTPSRLMLSDKIVRLKLTEHCNRRYINLVNSSSFARSYYSAIAGGTSSSMKNVTREQILNLPLPLAPLAEQHRIVAKVDELMALCDQLKAQLADARQQHAQLATVLVEQALA